MSQQLFDWDVSRAVCITRPVGGRKGWRLPSIAELASLIDSNVLPPGPTLPPGHPFVFILAADYWSATTAVNTTNTTRDAWKVDFAIGGIGANNKAINNSIRAWCVRGPMSESVY